MKKVGKKKENSTCIMNDGSDVIAKNTRRKRCKVYEVKITVELR